MNSIQEEISGTTIAGEIRLERAVHDGSFLLVEGSNDAKLFKKFCDPQECSITICFGRERLLEAITTLDRIHFAGALGIADRDFSELLSNPEFEGKVVFTDENDIEIMILCSPALDNLLNEFGAEDQISDIVNAGGKPVCEQIFNAASFLGTLRLLSQVEGWSLKFEGMTYQFIDRNSYSLDEPRTVEHVVGRSQQRPNMTGDEILTKIRDQLSKIDSPKKLCCGHDCVRVLGRALRRKIGKTSEFDNNNGAKILGHILRLAYEFDFFQQTSAYQEIRKWETLTGYNVFQQPA